MPQGPPPGQSTSTVPIPDPTTIDPQTGLPVGTSGQPGVAGTGTGNGGQSFVPGGISSIPTLPASGITSPGGNTLNADTLQSALTPGGLSNTPANSLASNPFLQLFMDASGKALNGARRIVGPGAPGYMPPGGAPQ